MHTSSSRISKSSELKLKYFMRSSKSVPDSITKILLNLPLKNKWFHLSRNSSILASVICYLRSIHIICTSPGEHLLLSSIGASLGSPQVLIGSDNRDISHVHKTISMRNMINLYIIRDDSLLGTLKYVSKTEDYQKYEALITKQMINQTLVLKDKPAKKPKWAKHPEPAKKSAPAKEDVSSKKPSRKKSTGLQIKDTLDVSVSKKKASATTDRSKGIDLLFEAALLEYAQIKKVLKRSKNETVAQVMELVLNKRVPDVPKDQSESENESWGESEDDADSNDDDVSDDDGNNDDSDDDEEEYDHEYVRTLSSYESTNDQNEHVDEEEYDRIDKELYKDVNMKLKDVEHGEEGKGDAKKTDAGHDDVTQETSYDPVEDDAHVTLTVVHDT
ncbi:hypothetical protein Tco_1015158 [Tanacetum coccineum]|uniref:Uncharacterized protein n=1 Tax=Tanacetum coccineum TaxID=301880 RepID=A0ABQ5FLC4_9ASTR